MVQIALQILEHHNIRISWATQIHGLSECHVQRQKNPITKTQMLSDWCANTPHNIDKNHKLYILNLGTPTTYSWRILEIPGMPITKVVREICQLSWWQVCVVNKTDFILLFSAGYCCSPYILDLYKIRVFRSQIRLIQLLFHIADLTTDLNQFWSKSKCFKVSEQANS